MKIDSELAWNLGFSGYIHLTPLTQQGDQIMRTSKEEILTGLSLLVRSLDSDLSESRPNWVKESILKRQERISKLVRMIKGSVVQINYEAIKS